MAKIALIAEQFAESTLAFANALATEGHIVDLYFFVYRKDQYDSPGFQFNTNKRKYGCIYEVDNKNAIGCSYTKKYPDCHVYVCQATPAMTQHRGIIGKIAREICRLSLIPMTKAIEKRRYDIVDVITLSDISITIARLIKSKKVVFSFHEIFTNHLCTKKCLKDSVEYAIKHKHPIRVFSRNVRDELIAANPKALELVHDIYFGKFSTYEEFVQQECSLKLPDNPFILYVGYIAPYKGLAFLYNAIREYLDKSQYSLVVAGKGYDSVLEIMSKDCNVQVINRFLTNSEIAHCVNKCRFIVCPYLSASQSGIPQTAFVFNKPLIATSVGAFPQIIGDNQFGLIVPPNDEKKMKEAISNLAEDISLYNRIVNNIKSLQSLRPYIEWNYIVAQYIKAYYVS